jgi:NAD(P)-dependent dehydrogenase (short-subunit alcohol dehydrogenase family)
MGGLTGRTVLITGAARGIGAASARRLAGEGARLVLADLDGSGVNALAAELGQVAIRADVTRTEDIEHMARGWVWSSDGERAGCRHESGDTVSWR